MNQPRVLSVVSEIYPLIKTGGLADVAGALPGVLRAEGVEMRTLVPGYPVVMAALEDVEQIHAFRNLFGGPARLLSARAKELDLFVLDAPHLYNRPGNPYIGPDGLDWSDNALRFGALCKIGAEIGKGMLPQFVPHVVHAHDWQTGLIPAYLRFGPRSRNKPGTVITIHNLAFQGQFSANMLNTLELPPKSFVFDGVEHYGLIGFLKAGLQLSDRITTVSPTYAAEIQREETGMGFDGLLRSRSWRLTGILNGLNTSVWNPAEDPHIVLNYDLDTISARSANKAAVQEALGLEMRPDAMLAGMITRLSDQKGLDMLLDVLPVLFEENMQIVVLGSGDAELEAKLRAAAEAQPGRIGVRIGYDETLAHRIQAGSDVMLVPSRFEPCGLTQLCALRYGAVPVVARVGGLADSIIDANDMALAAGVATGFQFSPVNSDAFAGALCKAAALFRKPNVWRKMQINGMTTDVSWRAPAKRFASLYRDLVMARQVEGIAA
jgi:starch synthase